ncbi:aar [Escherichia coli]|uniref:Aar n=1 Tax=Escherichia coli TaxID=562 RepID=A0A1W1EMI7_ECOLX|nr:aar [Escherichia coli]
MLSCYKFQKREHCIGGIYEGWKEFSFLVETSSFCREEYGSCTCF